MPAPAQKNARAWRGLIRGSARGRVRCHPWRAQSALCSNQVNGHRVGRRVDGSEQRDRFARRAHGGLVMCSMDEIHHCPGVRCKQRLKGACAKEMPNTIARRERGAREALAAEHSRRMRRAMAPPRELCDGRESRVVKKRVPRKSASRADARGASKSRQASHAIVAKKLENRGGGRGARNAPELRAKKIRAKKRETGTAGENCGSERGNECGETMRKSQRDVTRR